jgi:hypothetical protein
MIGSPALCLVRASLELLPDVQRNGDILFLKRWMDIALSGPRLPKPPRRSANFLRSIRHFRND